ncbi:type II toxin-antitoxin system HipA family toxin [Helicobacter bizzozeronii]|uniref:type II toxin-antitoxin system HipA family toxin n=1 Tax=Helicobacter bizzozeronii TaxID=56877 RepID=UPI000CEF59A1|nr:type II toxin-antitoxin system HipA family toxin [Helicobacter bizzozeronii]
MTISIFCNTERVGEIHVWAKGLKETYQFVYDPEWLKRGFGIDPALPLNDNPVISNHLWGCFDDIIPDRWGRLVQRRNAGGLLSESAYMLGVGDHFRLGALRCCVDGVFVNHTSQIPKTPHLQALHRVCVGLEKSKINPADLKPFLAPLGSLGGARSKACVQKDNVLCMAKFASIKDNKRQVPECEQTMLEVARIAKINTCESTLTQTDMGAVLLVKRFDRANNERIPYMSAMTLLGAIKDCDDDYCTLAQKLEPQERLELFRRMVFNGLFGNCDDHLKNHGLLYQNGKWCLSPAFDLVPNPIDFAKQHHTLAFAPKECLPSLDLFHSIMGEFGVSESQFKMILADMLKAQESFARIAKKNGVHKDNLVKLRHNYAHATFDLMRKMKLD